MKLNPDKLERAVELLRFELVPASGNIESQAYLLNCGRAEGIGPRVMKLAAAKLGIIFERHIHPDTQHARTYWRLPTALSKQ